MQDFIEESALEAQAKTRDCEHGMFQLGKKEEYKLFEQWMHSKVRTCRKKLDAKETDDWQTIGFLRGQIFMIKEIVKLMTTDPSKGLVNKK
jgi:hypothetical protein